MDNHNELIERRRIIGADTFCGVAFDKSYISLKDFFSDIKSFVFVLEF